MARSIVCASNTLHENLFARDLTISCHHYSLSSSSADPTKRGKVLFYDVLHRVTELAGSSPEGTLCCFPVPSLSLLLFHCKYTDTGADVLSVFTYQSLQLYNIKSLSFTNYICSKTKSRLVVVRDELL